MVSLLVVSDSHGNISALEAVLRWAASRSDTIESAVFLGDGVQDLQRAQTAAGFSLNWTMVRGNSDYEPAIPEVSCLEFEGRRIFLCHGHRYQLYDGFDTLIAAARNMEAEAAFFGHLHVPILENEDSILLVNPGSIGRPRSKIGATFALVDFPPEPSGPLTVKFLRIGFRGKITELPAH